MSSNQPKVITSIPVESFVEGKSLVEKDEQGLVAQKPEPQRIYGLRHQSQQCRQAFTFLNCDSNK